VVSIVSKEACRHAELLFWLAVPVSRDIFAWLLGPDPRAQQSEAPLLAVAGLLSKGRLTCVGNLFLFRSRSDLSARDVK
jgi:hypothetical protein